MEETVTNTVVGIRQGGSLLILLQIHILAESVHGGIILFQLEMAITQIIMSQRIHVGIPFACVAQIGLVVCNGGFVIAQAIFGFSPPEIGFTPSLLIVSPQRNGL